MSHWSIVKLRIFLSWWTRPAQPLIRIPRAVAEAQDRLRDARARGCCRDIGEARRELRYVRHDGLRSEIELTRNGVAQ